MTSELWNNIWTHYEKYVEKSVDYKLSADDGSASFHYGPFYDGKILCIFIYSLCL